MHDTVAPPFRFHCYIPQANHNEMVGPDDEDGSHLGFTGVFL